MSKIKILYVEDELALASIVKDTLETQDYAVRLISDGALVKMAIDDFSPDICLFDVMLPNIDGFTLGKEVKKDHPDLPIIFLTAKNQTADVITGFKSGGNDYLKKPFSLEELLIRIQNILSLHKKGNSSLAKEFIAIGKYQFYPQKLILKIDDTEKSLTHRESEIIKKFADHINDIIYKKNLLLNIWGDDSLYNSRNLDVYINKLRDYFSKDSSISIITLRGVGYRFNVEEK